jgi:hypothetical protein
MEAMLMPVDEPLIRALNLDAPCRIAEIGCGGGGTTLEILRRAPGSVVHGFDLSPALIELARSRKRSDERAIAFEIADMATAAAPEEPYGRLVLQSSPARIERRIVLLSGWLTEWGRSLLRPFGFFAATVLFFTNIYRFMDPTSAYHSAFEGWLTALIKALNITLVAGYTAHFDASSSLINQSVCVANLSLGIFWYSPIAGSVKTGSSMTRMPSRSHQTISEVRSAIIETVGAARTLVRSESKKFNSSGVRQIFTALRTCF